MALPLFKYGNGRMRNFFRKRRNSNYGDSGFTGDLKPEFGSRPAPFGPQLVSELDDVSDENYREGAAPRAGSYPADFGDAPARGGSGPLMRSAADLFQGRAQTRQAEPHNDEDVEQLPRFSMPVAGSMRAAARGHLPGITPELNRALREAFTPTRPKQEVNSLFVGRLNTLRRIIAAIEEERAHVVLFGDRGRGKTSLSNAISQIAQQAGYFTLKLTCSAELSFEDIFRNFLRRIPGTFCRSELDNPFASRQGPSNFEELLPTGSFSVTELNDVLGEIQGAHALLVLDEYDRVNNEELRNKLAELIKNLTDSAAPVTLFIVGVAENVDQLLGKHPSIQRSLVAVHLPLMTDREIERIIVAGSDAAGIGFNPEVRQQIVAMAKGLPYYAQLLSLHAARSAISRGSRDVGRPDLAYAVARCVQEAERGIVEAYNKSLGPDEKTSLTDVLYAAAQSHMDDFGTFSPNDITQVAIRETGETLALSSLQYPLNRLSDDERSGILQRIVEPGGFRYRFRNQMMRQYVLMRQAKERGLI
jgi:Cdc6-like AAA superfamily ATPase